MTEEQNISNHLGRMADKMILRDLKRYAPDVAPHEAVISRAGPGKWHFKYYAVEWNGDAADSGEARRKAWAAYLNLIGAPGY